MCSVQFVKLTSISVTATHLDLLSPAAPINSRKYNNETGINKRHHKLAYTFSRFGPSVALEFVTSVKLELVVLVSPRKTQLS